MRRRYTDARNAIERNREQWGLGDDVGTAPAGEGPAIGVHPLPLTGREQPAPYSLPLPIIPGSPLLDHPASSDSGTVDYEARQRGQLDEVREGGDAEPVSVYPNWESRLEGMRDFLAVGQPDLDEFAIVATPGFFTVDVYTVPQGYTAFLKRFRYFFQPLPGGVDELTCLATLLVDGIIVPDYFNLPLGPLMGAYEDCFVVAAQGRVLQLKIDFPDAVGDIDLNVTEFRALFYGNVRKRTGEPENRDVGVRAPPPRPQPVVVVPAPVRSAPQPQPTQTQVRRARSGISSGQGGAPKGNP
jgi:hypothetical protein